MLGAPGRSFTMMLALYDDRADGGEAYGSADGGEHESGREFLVGLLESAEGVAGGLGCAVDDAIHKAGLGAREASSSALLASVCI